MRLVLAPLLSLLLVAETVSAVKREDFKECHQTSFCRRLRSIASRQEAAEAEKLGSFQSPYTLGEPTSTPGVSGPASWTFPLSSSLYPDINFDLRVDVLEEGDGIVRIRADEVGSASQWHRYNETARWTLLEAEPKIGHAKMISAKGVSTIKYGKDEELSLEIVHNPLKITQKRNGEAQMIINDRSLFHMEHYRTKEVEELPDVGADGGDGADGADGGADGANAPEQKQAVMKAPGINRTWFEGVADGELFEESWKRWRDTKPKGGLSVLPVLTFRT